MRRFSIPAFRFSIVDPQAALGKWSRIATFGDKAKDGAKMRFDAETLGQMVDNAAARGDKIAICNDHASAYPETRDAPALGFFGALAVVAGGRVVKAWNGEPDAAGLDDGLYGRLDEITPRGADPLVGLANYRTLSPMFVANGADEAGNAIGYSLLDVGATNVPFQAGAEIMFHAVPSGATESTGAARRFTKETKMDEQAMAAKFGFEPGDDADKKMSKIMAAYAEAEKKMAAYEGKETDEEEKEEAEKMAAKLSAVEASNAALMSRLAAVEAAEQARAKAAEASKNAEIEALADAAVSGGYPADSRAAFVSFARVDFAGAKALAAPHIKSAPATLFNRLTAAGAPVGVDSKAAREDQRLTPPTIHKTPFGQVVAPDERLADEIKAVAFSSDPAVVAKVDAHLAVASDRKQPWARLVAAEKVVAKERPDLTNHAEAVRFAMLS